MVRCSAANLPVIRDAGDEVVVLPGGEHRSICDRCGDGVSESVAWGFLGLLRKTNWAFGLSGR